MNNLLVVIYAILCMMIWSCSYVDEPPQSDNDDKPTQLEYTQSELNDYLLRNPCAWYFLFPQSDNQEFNWYSLQSNLYYIDHPTVVPYLIQSEGQQDIYTILNQNYIYPISSEGGIFKFKCVPAPYNFVTLKPINCTIVTNGKTEKILFKQTENVGMSQNENNSFSIRFSENLSSHAKYLYITFQTQIDTAWGRHIDYSESIPLTISVCQLPKFGDFSLEELCCRRKELSDYSQTALNEYCINEVKNDYFVFPDINPESMTNSMISTLTKQFWTGGSLMWFKILSESQSVIYTNFTSRQDYPVSARGGEFVISEVPEGRMQMHVSKIYEGEYNLLSEVKNTYVNLKITELSPSIFKFNIQANPTSSPRRWKVVLESEDEFPADWDPSVAIKNIQYIYITQLPASDKFNMYKLHWGFMKPANLIKQ